MNSSQKRGAVEFRNITKTFGNFTAISDLNLVIEPGELVTLLGPSGCGKTTTLRMLAGLETPTLGEIFLGGEDVTRLPANRRDISMVFQSYALFPHMSILKNVAYGLESGGMTANEAKDVAQNGLELVGLAHLGKRLPAELSGGQQQRAAVARALVLEPQVLLLDEPLSNLDARLRRKVRTEIRDLQQRLGFTAVYVTHDQDEALAVSDRIVVMKDGQIAQMGVPRDLYESPASEFIADFMGEANLVEAEILSIKNELAKIDVGGLKIELPAQNNNKGKAKLALRSNAFRVAEKKSQNTLAGTVSSSAYLGDHVEYEIDCSLGLIFVVDEESDQPIPAGEPIYLELRSRGIAVIPAENSGEGQS